MSNKSSDAFNLITILGPTASGKTRLAVALANLLQGEIISADSRQVFRTMNIGTGKDLHEYGDVPFHLIDILEPGEEFNLFAFQRLFVSAFEKITSKKKIPILCGGTGLYLDAVLSGYNLVDVPEDIELRTGLEQKTDAELADMLARIQPRQHNTSDLADRKRTIRAIEIALYTLEHAEKYKPLPEITPLVFGIHWERSLLRRRITDRLRQRLASGMIEEVQSIYNSGISWEQLDYYGLEYRHISSFLQGRISKNDMFQKLDSAIQSFAKRQETWFRRMERNGIKIHWVEGTGDTVKDVMETICRLHYQFVK